MIICEKLEREPIVFKSITGITIVEFEKLYRQFTLLWIESEEKRLDSPDRQRAIGGGCHYTLALREQLLMTLLWLRLRLSKEALGLLFGIDKATASRNTRRVLPILRQLGDDWPEPPKRGESKNIEQAWRDYPDLLAIIDVTEPPVQRSSNSKKQKARLVIESIIAETNCSGRRKLNHSFLQRQVWGKQFGEWIAKLKELGISQSRIANCLGVSTSLISKWKAGQGTPEAHASTLTRCLRGRGLSVEVSEIIDWWALVTYWLSEDEIRRWDSKWQGSEAIVLEMQTIGLSWNVFIEREAYTENLRRLLLEERHFREPAVKRVCIWGMGGAGKTILAKSMALEDQVQHYFRNGILWAELGPEGDATSWLRQWCKLLKLPGWETASTGELYEKVKKHLSPIERRYLIVVDDVWRMKDAELLLVDGPQSRVLITSRDKELASKLDPQMIVVPLNVMSLEESLALLRRRTMPERWQELEVKRQAEELVELVERLPLAIALSADVVNTRGGDYTLNRLRDERIRLGLLEKSKIERREHSVRLALNVSYEVQPADHQRFFRWLSVFSYGSDFSSLVAARLLLEENDLEVEERLRQLVDSSLLLLSYEGAQGTARFRLHTLLHDCAREKLQAAGEWDTARKQYVAVYMQQTRSWQELLGKGVPGLEREWQVEAPNVTQALVHAGDLGWWNDVAMLIEHVASIARMSGHFGFLDEWLGRLESHNDQLHEKVRGLVVKAQVESAVTMRQWDEIIAKESVVVDDKAIDAKSRGYVWLGMALAHQSLGDTCAASRSWQRGWQCAEESGDPYLLADALRLKGDLMLLQGRPVDSLQEYFKAEKAYLELERNQEDLVNLYAQMGEAYNDTNAMSLALQFFRLAMDRSLALGWPMLIFKVGQRLVVLEMMMGNLKEAKGIVTKLDQVLPKFFDIEPFRSEQIGLFLRSKSGIENYEGNFRKAAELAEEALMHLQAGGVNADTLGFTWYMLSENRLKMEDYIGALQAARRARVMYEQAGVWLEVRQVIESIEERAQQGISRLADKQSKSR